MTTDDQRVPDEDEMRHAYWLTRMLDHHAAVDATFDRFLAHVRRDAAREALDGLSTWLGELAEKHPARSTHVPLMQGHIARYTTDHYPEETPATEQQTSQQEAELDSWMARAYEAEKRAWQAEKRLAGWMEHWNATARTGAVDEVAAILEANTRADQAEARIRAVRDVLAHHPYGGPDQEDAIRRALEG